MPRHKGRIRRLPTLVSFEHPEAMVIGLLQDALGATRRALNMAHPHVQSRSPAIIDLDHAERLAIIIQPCLIELDNLLDAYQHALAHQIVLRQLSQMDLPF